MWQEIRKALEGLIEETAAVGGGSLSPKVEVPPNRQLGDLAWAGALQLAKILGRPPREIAVDLAAKLEEKLRQAKPPSPLGWFEAKVTVAGPGFMNFRLRRGALVQKALEVGLTNHQATAREKVIVEHTNINPNKAAHIGHLRNAVLGDVLVRCLRFLGYPVEVQNYIDDTGVQVADVVVGFCFLPEAQLIPTVACYWPEVQDRPGFFQSFQKRWETGTLVDGQRLSEDFDDLCWQLYPQVTAWYEALPEALQYRQQVLHALEAGAFRHLSLPQATKLLASGDFAAPALARFAQAVAESNLRCHLLTMGELGVAYDLLPHESDILHLGFWQRTFSLLRQAGVVQLEKEGKNAGCWVLKLGDSPQFAGEASADKILVRSNGTVTYTAKDIAYQLWKLGLLRDEGGRPLDFAYTPFARYGQDTPASPVRYDQGPKVLYRTATTSSDTNLAFGGGARVYNVIDVRQSYPQAVVREALKLLGLPEAAANSIHFAYEMVALTPKAVRQLQESLGVDFGLSAEEEQKPFLEMSGRRGLGVKADELMATLFQEAEKAIRTRHGETDLPQDLPLRAWAIGVGALRYQMARQGRNRVLAFDFQESLAFEGDTGPYLQYSAVRARKIFTKLRAAGLDWDLRQAQQVLPSQELDDDLWELVLACLRTPEVVEKAVASLEFSLLASHARELAQSFHNLYHRHPVLHAENPKIRLLRAAVFLLFAQTMELILEGLLGIPIPPEM